MEHRELSIQCNKNRAPTVGSLHEALQKGSVGLPPRGLWIVSDKPKADCGIGHASRKTSRVLKGGAREGG